MKQYIPVSCNRDCGAGCPLIATVNNGRLVAVSDNPQKGPFMKGCLKGYRTADTIYAEDRLLKPLIRKHSGDDGTFQTISWNEAFDCVAEKLLTFRDLYGPESIMRIGGSGSCRGIVHNTALLTKRFFALFGGYTDTVGNYSSEASDFIRPFLFGKDAIGCSAENLLQSSLIILWGFNPSDTRFGCETELVLREAGRRKIPCIVIDPRKTRSVALTHAEWIPVKPGGDTAIIRAILYELLVQNKIDYRYLEKYSVGAVDLLEDLKKHFKEKFSDSWLMKESGVSLETCQKLCKNITDSKATAVIPGLSLQRALGGEETDRFLALLQLCTKNIGKPGGSVGASQWNQTEPVYCPKIPVPYCTQVRKVPVNEWADWIIDHNLEQNQEKIQMLYNVGGNYSIMSSNSNKVTKAIESCSFMVSHEMFMTPTAALSDLILPVTAYPERLDICTANGGFLFYSDKAVDPPAAVMNDYEIFSELAKRLGFKEAFTENRSADDWVEHLLHKSEITDISLFKEKGFYKKHEKPFIGLEQFFENPVTSPLSTPSGKIEFISEQYCYLGGDTFPGFLEPVVSEVYPLYLISPHEKYRVHSQNWNIPELQKYVDDRLMMHPEDAIKRGLQDNDPIIVVSADGSIYTTVVCSTSIMKGVVALKEGAWKTTAGASGSVNSLTSSISTLPSKGTRTHTCAVEVKKIH